MNFYSNRLVLVLFAILFFANQGLALGQPSEHMNLSQSVNELYPVFKRATGAINDEEKNQINDSIVLRLRQILSNPASAELSFDTLKQVGKISSPDGLFRIFTWNSVSSDISYHYYGFLQYKGKHKGDYKLFEFIDKAILGPASTKGTYTCDNWYGCLIYKILHNKWNGQDYYTLLETDMNNILSSKKIIEPLWFDDQTRPVFGKPVFLNEKAKIQDRMIFEYSSQAVMGLHYEEKLDMILFDHLSPIQAGMEGNYKFYGPDLSLDGFRFEKGQWVYVPNVKVLGK
jgi:hypothetical protein